MPTATSFVADARARHYWDGGGELGRRYRALLDLSEDAWDVYFVYGPDARWDAGLPPRPDWWMHQLGSKEAPRVVGPYFDAEEFARRTFRLLSAPAP